MTNPQSSGLPESPLSDAERLILELERRAAALQSDQEQVPLVPLLTFSLNNEWFALPLDKVKVVARLVEVTPVPGTSRYILGIINHKSALYPLVDVHELLSLEPQFPTRSSRFVIVSHENYTFAMLVDTMAEVREVKSNDLGTQVRTGTEVSRYISSELTIDFRLVGLLNLDAILNSVSDGAINLATY
ncbi:MAG TPA: chemotaxis protein CheW [Chloroflexia bacterium]|nr:chemotaxis protein CheW [Chloroflexia bacterium]